MKEEAKALYASLEEAVAACNTNVRLPIEKIECSFLAANHYWALLQSRLSNHVFPTEEAEIDFFKNVKPLFTSAIEYYGLVAHVQLFKDQVTDKEDLKKFIKRELMRREKFAEANHTFCEYFKDGHSYNDSLWFIRANSDGGNCLHAKPYDLDPGSATRCDYLISSILALDRYNEYLRHEYEAISAVET